MNQKSIDDSTEPSVIPDEGETSTNFETHQDTTKILTRENLSKLDKTKATVEEYINSLSFDSFPQTTR